MYRILVVLLLTVFCAAPAYATSLEDIWGDVHPLLSKAVAELDLRGNVPDSTWNPLKPDKNSVDSKINDLLDECIEILGISNMSVTKKAIQKLQADSKVCREKVAELKTERLAAPKKVKKWEVWKNTVESIDEDIKKLEIREEDNGNRVDVLVDELLAEMKKIGMKVDREQVETLVYSVTGNDDVELVSVFNNVKLITTELQRLTSEANENIEMAKRYYGMHTLLLRILINLYQHYEHKINDVYMVRIKDIITKENELIEKTKTKIAEEPAKYTVIYKTNLIAQGLTIRTARMYSDYLEKNRDRIVRARQGVEDEYDVALNTYETVQGAHSLISLMRNANAMLERMSELQTPELIVFQNIEMKNEFRKLTGKLTADTD
ncbi:hypothetical protein [Maridesulfovibrio zosterae]|uniref:hypothetical protein n=1 Tax=Maridesulfovibrio zosterae TaxID=82171 RepID=UPI00041A4E2F|nr:hypothetical protein [Maridesulfovibrio zosterae]